MFRRSGSKAIGSMVVQTRTASGQGAVSGLIWSEGAARGAAPQVNAAGRTRGLFIEGRVAGDADISVNGHIRGEIDVTSLTVDEEGLVEGRITAEQVEVRGRVIGDIRAGRITLHPSAVVKGDLTYRQLSIALGSTFQGSCRQLPEADAAEAAAAEPAAPASAPRGPRPEARFPADKPPSFPGVPIGGSGGLLN